MSPSTVRSPAIRRLKNRLFVVLCLGATILAVAILAVLIGAIVWRGRAYLDWDFLTSFPSRKPAEAGMKAAVWGTVWLCAVCALVAIPLGVGTAIVLEEFRPRKRAARVLHRVVQLNITNLAGVPSIVYGILGLTVFVRMFGLLGSPNPALYDEMLKIELRGGEVIQAFLVEQRDTEAVVDSPLRGTLTIPSAEISEMRRVFVKRHAFKLTGGDWIAGDLADASDGQITVTLPSGQDRTFAAADVERYSSTNFIQFGNPDGFLYLRFPLGSSILAGGLTLALVVLPIVIIASQEALRAVPDSLRDGTYALGATRWQMVRRMTLPSAIPGIMTGSILAVSRAIGEAAPLLVIGGFLFIMFTPRNLMDDFAAMPLQIFNWASRPQEEFHKVAASGILVLLAVLLFFNGIAIVVRHRFQKPLQ